MLRPAKTAKTDITQQMDPERAHLVMLERSLIKIRTAAPNVLQGLILNLALLNA
jgi:hypothetical protein